MSVPEQGRVFAAMMLGGAALGLAYDFLSFLRCGRLMTAAADLLLAPLGAAIVIGMALMLRCEPFRLFVLLGMALGWLVYFFSLGTIVRFLINGFKNLSKKVTN